LFIGFSLSGTGPSSTVGTFVMSGRFQDFGSSTANNIRLVPIDGSNRSRLSGTRAHAAISGQGSFLIVVDQISNQFIGTETGNSED
jgi:hypothetical protein